MNDTSKNGKNKIAQSMFNSVKWSKIKEGELRVGRLFGAIETVDIVRTNDLIPAVAYLDTNIKEFLKQIRSVWKRWKTKCMRNAGILVKSNKLSIFWEKLKTTLNIFYYNYLDTRDETEHQFDFYDFQQKTMFIIKVSNGTDGEHNLEIEVGLNI